MTQYEYQVVPAPMRGQRVKGVKGTDARFAHTLSSLMNNLGEDGWEYLRADTLPCEERQGLTGRSIVYKTLLVFRRVIAEIAVKTPEPRADAPEPAPAPDPAPPAAEPEAAAPPPKLPGFSRAMPVNAAPENTEPAPEPPVTAGEDALDHLIDEEAPRDEAESKLLTKRGHSFATYSPNSRLPGVRTRD